MDGDTPDAPRESMDARMRQFFEETHRVIRGDREQLIPFRTARPSGSPGSTGHPFPPRSGCVRAFYYSALALSFAALTIAQGCGDGAKPGENAAGVPVEARVEQVTPGPVPELVPMVGLLTPLEDLTVSAEVGGRIVSFAADLGDSVRSGDELAKIDEREYLIRKEQREKALRESLAGLGLSEVPGPDFDTDAMPEVLQAKTVAKNTQERLERLKKLTETKRAVSEQEVADARAAAAVAEKQLEAARFQARARLAEALTRRAEADLAQVELEHTVVRAPKRRDGSEVQFQVAQRSVEKGEFIDRGGAMFRLIHDEQLILRGGVPEAQSRKVAVGQPVRIQSADAPPLAGVVSRVSPEVDTKSRAVNIEITVGNEQRTLAANSFARASIEVGRKNDVPWVPKSAVRSFAGVNRVFRVVQGKAQSRVVQLGPEADGKVAILSGIDAGDQVVVSDLSQVGDGTTIKLAGAATAGS